MYLRTYITLAIKLSAKKQPCNYLCLFQNILSPQHQPECVLQSNYVIFPAKLAEHDFIWLGAINS